MNTISSVIGRLDEIIKQCEQRRDRAGYFAALYKRMTVAVKEGIEKNAFENGARMERLDVLFAKRYIDAFEAYYSGKPCTQSWKYAFDSSKSNSPVVLQHLLMGINTHINLDLSIAAALTAPGKDLDALGNDFNRINNVITTLVDDVQECLCKVWWPMRFLVRVANGKQMAVLNFSVEKARQASWLNATLLANQNTEQQDAHIKFLDARVKELAMRILQPGTAAGMMLQMVRATEYNDVAKIIHLINTTEVA